MLCPVCHLELIPTDLSAFGLVVVQRCTHCSGSWLTREQAERLGESMVVEMAAMPGGPSAAPCPQCGAPLAVVRPPGEKEAHRCVACGGFWIDQGQVDPVGPLVDHESSRVIDCRSVDARPGHWSALRWIAWRLRRCYE